MDEASSADSSAGAMAATKATAAGVRKFAIMTMSDQHALRVSARTLARELGITTTPKSSEFLAQAKGGDATLGAMATAEAWDSAYADREVTYLTQLIESLKKLLPTVRSAELKSLVEA
ncbi:MAG: DUF4142 domain-containing protein, partial [Gemmatimonadota bacterium]|nr:DUF4142 domain-containing protein [Gemmatimonadota bacterium]